MNKSMITAALIAAFLILIGIDHFNSNQDQELVVASRGGSYTDSQILAFHKPFMEETGITVNSTTFSGGLAEVKSQVLTGKVTWDIVDMGLSDSIIACDEGILEAINIESFPNGSDGTTAQNDFINGTIFDCGVANIIYSVVVAYDGKKFTDETAPQTVADYFDLEKFPGQRGMRKYAQGTLEFALMADGVPNADVYKVLGTEEGVNRAFKKMDTIKDHIIWWSAGAQAPQLLADGEVVMSTSFNGRLFTSNNSENQDFRIIWEKQVWAAGSWGIPKGGPNTDRAKQFMKFATASEQMVTQSSMISYGPARKSANKLVGKHFETGVDMKPNMPTYAENFKDSLGIDVTFWADYGTDLNEKFHVWLLQ